MRLFQAKTVQLITFPTGREAAAGHLQVNANLEANNRVTYNQRLRRLKMLKKPCQLI